MLRRLVLCVLLLALVLSFGVAAEEVEIVYWSRWDLNAAEEVIIDRFNELYAGRIRVVAEPRGAPDQLIAAVAGGVPPSVAKVDRFVIGGLASSGVLISLENFVRRDEAEVQPADIFPGALAETVYNGQIYALPFTLDARGLWYNKSRFEEVGLDSNAPPRTWEEMVEVSRNLDQWGPAQQLEKVAFIPTTGNWYFPGWLWAAGGDLLDETNRKVIWNSAEGIQALSWMEERLAHYGGWSALDVLNNRFPSGAFVAGASAMEINTPSRLGAIQDQDWEWGVAHPPRPAGLEHEPISWSGGFSMAIPTGANHIEEAWEFVKFAASTWAQVQKTVIRDRVPMRISVVQELGGDISPHLGVMVELMPYSRFRPVVPVGDELQTIYRSRVESLVREGRMPPEQILNETAREAQLILDASWAQIEN